MSYKGDKAMCNEPQWPEDKADWPKSVDVVQGGVCQIASTVVNDRESADLASAVRNVINKAEQKTGLRPDVVVAKPHHAAPQPATNDCREGKSSAVNASETSEDGRKFVADYFANVLVRHDFAGYINEHLAADFACVLADGLHALQKHCDGFAAQAAFQRDARLGALKELAKVEKQRDELLKIAKDVIGMLENCSVESGVCHCGDDMARHSSAMSCGHAPVDIGSTYAAHLYEKARAAIASVKGGAE